MELDLQVKYPINEQKRNCNMSKHALKVQREYLKTIQKSTESLWDFKNLI